MWVANVAMDGLLEESRFSVVQIRSASQLQRGTQKEELQKLGACAMTTKVVDNKICTFKILLSRLFPRQKTAFLPPMRPPPPSKMETLFILSSRRL